MQRALQDAYIPKDPATAKQAHRGFGFVTFASADDVDKVMSCAHSINNQELAVQCAIPKVRSLFSVQQPGTKQSSAAPNSKNWQSSHQCQGAQLSACLHTGEL